MTGARAVRVRCPAKVNLVLEVRGLRDDGYHEIRTLFQAVDLWDELEARPAPRLQLACGDPSVPHGPDNLVLRAADLLRREFRVTDAGAVLRLVKRIPVGGGLGGGSSDAAGALVALSRLWDLAPAPGVLARLASGLGADVPFFLQGGTAWGRGRGDILAAAPFPGPLPVLLAVPPFPISTEDVYRRMAAKLTRHGEAVNLSRRLTHKSNGENDFWMGRNDLEQVVFPERRDLERCRDALLRAGARAALLSGSGSTVFGVFRDAGEVETVRRTLGPRLRGWSMVPTRFVPHGIREAEAGDPQR